MTPPKFPPTAKNVASVVPTTNLLVGGNVPPYTTASVGVLGRLEEAGGGGVGVEDDVDGVSSPFAAT